MTEEEEYKLVCGRPEFAIDDAMHDQCSECGTVVAVSSEGVEFMKTKEDITIICGDCYMADSDQGQVMAVPGALEKIQEHLGEEASEEMKRFLRMMNARWQ